MKFFVEGSPADSWAVIKAHYDFLIGIRPDLIKRRKLTAIGYTVTNQYPRLLTFEFFLLGKKTFHDLGKF
jgi:hypothetical protein